MNARNILDTAQNVRKALEDARSAQEKAERAISQAQSDITVAETDLSTVRIMPSFIYLSSFFFLITFHNGLFFMLFTYIHSLWINRK